MKVFFIFALLNFFFISSFAAFAESFVVCGEAGSGKSTLISSLFGVTTPVGMYMSQARHTKRYTATSRAVPALRNSIVYDTPGISDYGMTNEEILSEIEADYLREIRTNRAATLDGFILTISSRQARVRLREQIESLASSFSSSAIKSMVIVLNLFDSDSWEKVNEISRYVELRAAQISGEAFHNEFVQIPVVILNAKNPTDDQINDLISALSRVQKYHLVNLEKKEQEVLKIYEDLRSDPKIMKELVEKIIDDFEAEFQVFKKVPGEWLKEEEKGSSLEERISKVLQNEKEISWNQAVGIYRDKNRVKIQGHYDL